MDVAKILEMPLRMKMKQNMVFNNIFFLTVLIAGTKKPLEMIAPVNNKSEKDNISQDFSSSEHDVEKQEQSESTRRELQFLTLYNSLNISGRMTVGHQLTDFIKSCRFGGLECEIDDGFVLFE